MFAIFCLLAAGTQIAQRFLRRGQAILDRFLLRFERVPRFKFSGQIGLQRFDFALTLHHAMELGLWAVKHQSVLAIKMAVRCHQHRTKRQRGHLCGRIGFVFQHEHIGETLTHKRQNGSIVGRDEIRERCKSRDRCRCGAAVFKVQRNAARRRIARHATNHALVV